MNVTELDNGCICKRLICHDPFMCLVHRRLITDVVLAERERVERRLGDLNRLRDRNQP